GKQKRVVEPATAEEEARPLTDWADDLADLGPELARVPKARPLLNPDWNNLLRRMLADRVSEAAADSVNGKEEQPAHGILSLVARSEAEDRLNAPLISWLASWNPWMWRSSSDFALFSPYLLGLLGLAVLIALVRAGLTL